METIQIGYSPIWLSGNLLHHKYIVYTRSDGTTFEIHGGGNGVSFETTNLGLELVGLDGYGNLSMTAFMSTAKRQTEMATHRKEVLFSGSDLSGLFFKMVGIAQGIAEEGTSYNPKSNNSNTLADKTVMFAGGTAPTSDASAPGSLDDSQFNPDLFSKLGPVIWGKNTYSKHNDIVKELYGIDKSNFCFPADTLILTSLTSSRPIADLRPGDVVLAFDPAADLGRGALVPRRVKRIWRNTTTEWVRLRWAENGEARELVATPGHHFLDVAGGFPALAEMIRDGRVAGS